MISLAATIAALLTSPMAPAPPCDDQGFPVASVAACRASCSWWSKYERRCRDVDVEVIGPWDPRPAPHEWSSGYSTSSPPDWPAYPLEKANAP